MRLLDWRYYKLKDIEQFVQSVLEEITGEVIEDNGLMLLEKELLDSMSILFLVSEIEDKFEIQIPMEDVVEDNFKNIESIARYVSEKVKNISGGQE